MNYLTLKEFKAMFDTLGVKYTVEPYHHTMLIADNYERFVCGEPCEVCICIPDPDPTHHGGEVRLCFLSDGSIWDYIHNDWREPDQVPDDITDEALL